MSTVRLQPVDEDVLPRLLDVAVADADPAEVMPPVAGPEGWTGERRAAFLAFHRSTEEATYALIVDGDVVGAARLAPADSPGTMEMDVWLARSVRGKGYGVEALHLLVEEARARGASAVIAETTMSNVPAVAALRALGAKLWEDPESGAVHATLRVGDSITP